VLHHQAGKYDVLKIKSAQYASGGEFRKPHPVAAEQSRFGYEPGKLERLYFPGFYDMLREYFEDLPPAQQKAHDI
jgi:hypothetical protein